MSIRKTIIALSLVFPSLSAFAVDQGDIEKSVQLKGGSTVHQFKDGKMAMEDKFGRTFRMKEGEIMETMDGKGSCWALLYIKKHWWWSSARFWCWKPIQ